MTTLWVIFSTVTGGLVGLGLGILNSWDRPLFCKHEYRFACNIYSDAIIAFNWKRSLWKCIKCGKVQLREELHYELPEKELI